MSAAVNYLRRLWFHLRWLTMSDRDRYTYLWNRTKNIHWRQAHSFR
jgi:hypothetical protein